MIVGNKDTYRQTVQNLQRKVISWDDNEVSSSSDSERKECVNLALMSSHHSNDKEEEVNNEISSYNDDAQ